MENKEMLFAPSILASDFSSPLSGLKEIENSGCDYVHLDVMDGSFVPEITFGSKFISDLRKSSDLIFDTHLMVNTPELHIPLLKAGSDIITIHAEATKHLHRCISLIKDGGKMAGVALNPATPISFIEPVLPIIDYLLIMSVNPGWGGQPFIPTSLSKIEEAERRKNEEGYNYIIAVDGGISKSTIKAVSNSGANLFVMGSAFFKESDKVAFIEELKEIIES